MNEYFVFGGYLRSELEFPDLSRGVAAGRPEWELRVEPGPPPDPIELQGTRWIEPGWTYFLHRVEGGLRLDYGETGSYGIFESGRRIVWYPGPEPMDPAVRDEMVRAIVLGPVMALALQRSGLLCLHGSAVTIGDRGVGFIAPKLHGKSTLALALVDAGARLLTDDLVAIEPTHAPVVRPGVHSVRLGKDIVDRLGGRFPGSVLKQGFKTTLTALSAEQLAWEPVPLAALYHLRPTADLIDGSPVRREMLPPTEAAAALALGKKLTDGLMGSANAAAALDWIAAVCTRVPVHRLSFVRDLDRLPEIVGEVMAWHESPTATRAD
jgi:hypothetical protein